MLPLKIDDDRAQNAITIDQINAFMPNQKATAMPDEIMTVGSGIKSLLVTVIAGAVKVRRHRAITGLFIQFSKANIRNDM